MKRIQPVLYAIGILLTLLSGAMAIPALVDLYHDNSDWESFTAAAFITAFFGVSLMLTNRGFENKMGIRQAFMLTTGAWAIIPLFASIPFMYGELNTSFTDAYFEAMSGLTTTGATVLTGLDYMAPGILIWRAILVALGGVGIIVMAITILPMLKIGGMQLFRTENSDNSDKIMPRATQIARSIIITYILMFVACAVLFLNAGMSLFDAICHGLSVTATSGFANYDASIGYFKSAHIEWITMGFILLGSLPFVHYIQFVRGNAEPLYRDKQVRAFLSLVLVCTAMVVIWTLAHHTIPFWDAVRRSAFMVISIISTSGFVASDYTQWGSFVIVMVFMLTVLGGCTGSTTGGIKTFRLMVLFEIAKTQIHQLIQPHVISRPSFNNRPLGDSDITSVMGFIVLWGVTFLVITIALSATELDFITSMSAAAASLANTGPGLGAAIGPVSNYASLSDTAKWILCLAMLIGRLELYSVLVFFSIRFWRY